MNLHVLHEPSPELYSRYMELRLVAEDVVVQNVPDRLLQTAIASAMALPTAYRSTPVLLSMTHTSPARSMSKGMSDPNQKRPTLSMTRPPAEDDWFDVMVLP